MDNMTKNQEFSLELQEKNFSAGVLKTSVLCLAFVIALTAAAYFFLTRAGCMQNAEIGFFYSDLNPMIFTSDMDGLVGGDEVKVGINSCTFDENSITLKIIAKNYSDKSYTADGKTFTVSSFNTNAAETRFHYFADAWSDTVVPAHGQYEFELTFPVDGAKEKEKNGYIFSLSAFRESDMSTIEISLSE